MLLGLKFVKGYKSTAQGEKCPNARWSDKHGEEMSNRRKDVLRSIFIDSNDSAK